MKRPLLLLAALMLVCCAALAEETAAFTPIPWETEISPYAPNPDCYLPDTAGYHDESIDISIWMDRAYDTHIMLMRVKLTDPSQLRTAMAGKYPSKNVTAVKRMTKKVNAVAGVSGDYFNFHGDGIVMRNGALLRNKPNDGRDTLIIDKNGDFTIFSPTFQRARYKQEHGALEKGYTVAPTTKEQWEAYDQSQAVHVFCYGPALVLDGEPLTDSDAVMLSCGKNKVAQRMAIAQTGPLEYLFIATEGPENTGSKGLTIVQMADYCASLGLDNAYNLDGGSSETIVLNNRKINSLSSHKERDVGDCIWFATLVPNE